MNVTGIIRLGFLIPVLIWWSNCLRLFGVDLSSGWIVYWKSENWGGRSRCQTIHGPYPWDREFKRSFVKIGKKYMTAILQWLNKYCLRLQVQSFNQCISDEGLVSKILEFLFYL